MEIRLILDGSIKPPDGHVTVFLGYFGNLPSELIVGSLKRIKEIPL
jgi:hypothetical protein